ncbi:MAG: hypothetical protein H6835_14720 [Planctomycetes bacterium]|nr:hypothetical protein [Planctomycetota bacterium]
MKIRTLLLLASLVCPAAAQLTVTSPVANPVDVNRPFGGGIGRYQQWYSFNSLASITEPVRIQQLDFFAGNNVAPQLVQINCEVLIGHGKFSGVFGTFDSNWATPPVTVKATGNVALNPVGSGAVCFSVPFSTKFTWDHFHPILIEIRIYNTSLGGGTFAHNCQGVTTSLGVTSRVYASGSPGATTGTVGQGIGLITRFSARPGVNLPLGAGCMAEGAIVPGANVLEVPSPGITWHHQIFDAPSQRPAFLVLGDQDLSATPIDLLPLFGLPSSPCVLYTFPANVVGPVMTVGGGPGAGIGSLAISLPGVTSYVGASFYSQWVVFDPFSLTGLLATTPATWSIVAPVGG